MKILVIGGGGREHALVWKLRQSPHAERIFCAPGNAGTAEFGENIAIAAGNVAAVIRFAKENRVDLTVIGPDDPLAAGIVDLFAAQNLRIFGPTKAAAQIESSKIFAKELMREQGIPTAQAGTFERSDAALRFCAECSLHALVDGADYRLLETARDHKRAFDGDTGPNTGGMGAFSPANNWSAPLEDQFDKKIMRPLLRGLQEKSITFRGLLFPGLMISTDGARVLEFNCRFGDPETQAILPRMKSDLLPLLDATIDGKIDSCSIEWDQRPAVTVVLVSGGYPDKYETGKTISGLGDAAKLGGVQIFHAGTKRANGQIVTAGGRVLAVTALGSTIEAARARAYEAVACIHFENCRYRRDIALSAVAP